MFSRIRVLHNKTGFVEASVQLFSVLFLLVIPIASPAQLSPDDQKLHYVVSFPQPDTHVYRVTLHASGWHTDLLKFKMPNWKPGYYQIMDYSKTVANFLIEDDTGRKLPFDQLNQNTWVVRDIKNRPFVLSYDIKTHRQFVANSYVDDAHAYLVPGNTFVYIDGLIDMPVSVEILPDPRWPDIATGLDVNQENELLFSAPDFDILYDSPILIGNLDFLPSFFVGGVEHRFIAYNMGSFDSAAFIGQLQKIVAAAAAIIGDIPYERYTFIGIGPGKGGIEHLNSTAVSFDGNTFSEPGLMQKALLFLGHEYIHHYNGKRIRPLELGPFDYDQGSRTNLLWVTEGLSVYYEYLAAARAGIVDERTVLSYFENHINTTENNPGRHYQSLQQASYNTWKDGPFGTQGEDPGKAISYYSKGPIVGLLLDFAIRNATDNRKSLDDVMRFLYRRYYQELQRGFTDAEFQQACETIAGTALTEIFEYVYTTRDLDYATYLAKGGLMLHAETASAADADQAAKFSLTRMDNIDQLQLAIFNSWSGQE